MKQEFLARLKNNGMKEETKKIGIAPSHAIKEMSRQEIIEKKSKII